jgi:hypothetical protein
MDSKNSKDFNISPPEKKSVKEIIRGRPPKQEMEKQEASPPPPTNEPYRTPLEEFLGEVFDTLDVSKNLDKIGVSIPKIPEITIFDKEHKIFEYLFYCAPFVSILMFVILYFSNRADPMLLVPAYVLFLSFSYIFVYLLYRMEIFIRSKIFKKYFEMNTKLLLTGTIFFSLVFFSIAALVPGYYARKTASDFNICQENCRNISESLEKYRAKDKKSKLYPSGLDKLAPNSIASIPCCPAANRDTYSATYQVSSTGEAYTFYCQGENHRSATKWPGNWPQFSSIKGLMVKPIPRDDLHLPEPTDTSVPVTPTPTSTDSPVPAPIPADDPSINSTDIPELEPYAPEPEVRKTPVKKGKPPVTKTKKAEANNKISEEKKEDKKVEELDNSSEI